MIDSIGLPREFDSAGLHLRHWLLQLRRTRKRVMCVLMGGHWQVRHTTRNHIALRCVACGHSTPGWDVGRGSRPRA